MTFIISVLTGLGVGSGGLYILYLTLIKNIPQAEAQGMNLAFFITATLAAATVNLIKKRISFVSLALAVPFGIIGAAVGCRVASAMDTKLLSVIFGVLLAIVGVTGFFKLIKKR